MKKVLTSNVEELNTDALHALVEAGFKQIGNGNKFVNYNWEFNNHFDLFGKLYDMDLWLDEGTKWVNKKPETYYIINQGYRCPNCNGLDMQPNLTCVKE